PSDEAESIKRKKNIDNGGLMNNHNDLLEKVGDIKKEEMAIEVKEIMNRKNNSTGEKNSKNVLKIFLQNQYSAVKRLPIFDVIANSMPAILVAVSLILMNIDQDTDIYSSYQICTVPCKCVFNSRGVCGLAMDSVGEDH
ncbi:unnamed protein product, partial [Meganyctiphanes norvegica]